ncbi:MAG: molybdopterin-dependent oxidoreductase [Cyanobacteria bacterium P01_H01_bin.121]
MASNRKNRVMVQEQQKVQQKLSRRRLLNLSGVTGLGLLLQSCTNKPLARRIGEISEPPNQAIEEWLQSPEPAPEFSLQEIQPEQLLINSYFGVPYVDPATFRLKITGEVAQPLELSLAELQAMPLTTMVVRHVCVEGWAAIVQWGGVRLQDLLALAQPTANARYVYFDSADGYYESWDLESAIHPQTLMVHQRDGGPLPLENGAPLRLAAPIKLGYKQSKWVTAITLTSQLEARRGIYEDKLGYEWFAGL